ncbi:hypothetical protein LPJ63_004089 [Coemansia sp. RSA 2711]|nr:hypothetical protein LPJ63_004089 [Coemansia sp. RSA 2711]
MGLGGVILVCLGLLRPRGGGGYHMGMHQGMTGFFTGCGLASIGIVALSSAMFAGIRRATGLTFRRTLKWPPFDLQTSQRWLRWYDTKLDDLHTKAEHRLASLVDRYAPKIDDPNVRRVWEQQLREDTMRKVERIRERRKYWADLVVQAEAAEANPHDQQQRRHPPLLAVYLYVGEWMFDCVAAWMRSNSHCVVEPREPTHGIAMEDLLNDDDCDFPGIRPSDAVRSPAPFIATAAPMPPPLSATLTEPSAPALSDSDFLKLPASEFAPHASTSRAPLAGRQAVDPPPYTPVDEDSPGKDKSADSALMEPFM